MHIYSNTYNRSMPQAMPQEMQLTMAGPLGHGLGTALGTRLQAYNALSARHPSGPGSFKLGSRWTRAGVAGPARQPVTVTVHLGQGV